MRLSPLLRRSISSSSLVALGIAATRLVAHAQGAVWVVDDQPGLGVDFTSIQDAIAASADGDTVLVKSGSYVGPVVVSAKSLVLIADVGADVRISNGISVYDVDAPRAVVVRGLRVPGNSIVYPYALHISQSSGAVWVEDCALEGSHALGGPANGAFVYASAAPAFARCTIRGGSGISEAGGPGPGGAALHAENSVHMFDCVLNGGDAYPGLGGSPFFPPVSGGSGAQLIAPAQLFASGSVIAGGAGANGYAFGLGCIGGGPGGAAIQVLNAGAHAFALACTLQGGSGGAAFGACAAGAVGLLGTPANAFEFVAGAAHALVIASPVRENQLASAQLTGVPGELALLALSTTAQPGVLQLGWGGALLLAPPVLLAGVGSVPPSGSLQVSASLTALPPGIEASTLFAEPVFVDAAALSVALGSPSTLTVLDAAL